MPIPKLRPKKSQSWRNNKKKYYLNRSKNRSVLNLRKKKRRSVSAGYSRGASNLWQFLKPKLIWSVILLGLFGIIFIFGFVFWISKDLPEPGKLTERELAESTKIFDRTGEELLYEIHGNEQRTLVDLSDLPDYVKHASIAIEDKTFYEHGGVSLWGILRGVVWQKIKGERMQGGSTLTQQFVKNAILSNERTIERKIKEWLLAYKLEQKYSKDEILQMYLNEIPYGSTAYGIEAASQKYLGKSAKDLSLAEAAVLAALPQAPSKYSPYGANKDLLLGRKDTVLDSMFAQGYVTEEDIDIAKAEIIEFKARGTNIKAPHFVMYIKEILGEKYGEKRVEQGGLKIITTLDLYKQEIAEEVIKEQAEKNSEQYEASNAALVSIDPKTGQILAMVGSKDYFDDEIDGQVNITTSIRQPGSSMKPLVYATSFLKGYTPDTVLYDVVTNFSNDETKPYEPHNYDLAEHGPVTIRKALAGSLNIPAVKAIYLAGTQNVLDLAKDIGYSTFVDAERYGLSLVLGGGEVKMIEHVNAFSVFAREGVVQDVIGILRVEDKDSNVLEEFEKKDGKKVLDAKIARMINNILSDNAARAYTFGERNWLTLGSRPVAAKTGTTNDYRDAWTIGYTPSIVTGVWVGNNDNSEMKRGAAGGVVAAPIWHNFMDKVLGDTPIENFKEPEIVKTGKAVLDGEVGAPKIVKIDSITRMLASEDTPEHLIEEKTFYEPHSILYYVDPKDPLGDAPKNPEKDEQFELWESRVLAWAEKQVSTSSEFSQEKPPTEIDDVHTKENKPSLKVLHPSKNQTVLEEELVSMVAVSAKRGIDRVEYYINDNLLQVSKIYPYSLRANVNFLSNGFHNLRVRACDDVDNCSDVQVEFNLILENNTAVSSTDVRIESPGSGLAISNIDFPQKIVFKVSEQKAVAKINVYKKGEKENMPTLIGVIEPVNNDGVIFEWLEVPKTDTYKIYGEAITWSKKSVVSEEIILIVNNIETE